MNANRLIAIGMLVVTGLFLPVVGDVAPGLSPARAALKVGATSSTRPAKGLIEMRNDDYPVVLTHAVERLRANSPIPLDLSCSPDPHVNPELYEFTIVLGVTGNDPDLEKAWNGNIPDSQDAWALKTLSKSPLTIALTGKRPRGVLYAAYRLADDMKLGRDLGALNETHVPLVGEREAWVTSTASVGGAGLASRYSQYTSTLNELPRYGLNGVMIVPGHLSPPPPEPGHETLPLFADKDGKFRVDESRRLEWMSLLDAIKSYDMNVTLTADPLTPPGYSPSQVESFVKTGVIPPLYLREVRTFYSDFINKLLDALPQVDAISLTPGVEGAMYRQSGAIHTVRLYLAGQDMRACNRIMGTYLDVVTRIAKVRGKRVVFWIHSYGTTSDGLRAMWELPAQYPGVIRMGEDYWPNEIWAVGGTRVPIMAYLPPDVRAHVEKGAPLGALAITDAEFYGGGALPDAFADPYVYSAQELIKRQCSWMTFRLNCSDMTPWGTLWSVAEIQILQFANAIWTPALSPQQIWDEWVERRYGNAATPFVSAALATSGAIIHDGFSIEGIGLFHHSMIGPTRWTPSQAYSYESSSFHMFGRPGTLIYDKGPNGSRFSYEQWPAQVDAKAISIQEFRQQQARARQEVEKSLADLDEASPFLSRPDDFYLHSIFSNARQAIRVFSALGEMAYAANLLTDNYAHEADPNALFEKTAADVERLANDPAIRALSYAHAQVHAGKDLSEDDMKASLLRIVALYREYATHH